MEIDIDDQGRPEPPLAGTEAETLIGFLDFHRATLAWKTDGLDRAGMTTTVGASTMTLAGLLKHLALVEDDWFGHVLLGLPDDEPWASVDWDADRDWEWHTADEDDPDDLRALWTASVQRSRRRTAEALRDGGPARLADRQNRDGRAPSLRWILVHMIEEYARHNGHADLLREAADGQVGE